MTQLDEKANRHGSAADGGRKSGWRRFEFVIIVGIALLVALVIRSFVVQQFWIPSGSMEHTLQENDRVLVNKLAYRFGDIERGDIVVFSGEGSWGPTPSGDLDYIKRVIGLPGDVVEGGGKQDAISVNGVELDESEYLPPGERPAWKKFQVTVPRGHVWVMGDNRADSQDSRAHRDDPGGGAIPIDQVVGRAFVIIWPLDRAELLGGPEAFEKLNAS